MVRASLLFICFLFITGLRAQNYTPFPDSGFVWKETKGQTVCCPGYNDRYDYQLEIISTFQDGSDTYSQLYIKQWHYYTSYSNPSSSYSEYSEGNYGFLHQDTNRHVYYNWTLLYDFNLNVGDTLPQTYSDFNTVIGVNIVKSIDSVLIGSTYRRRFNIGYHYEPDPFASLIEGIGSTLGLLNAINKPFEIGSSLDCAYESGQLVYGGGCTLLSDQKKEENFGLVAFPNPFIDRLEIKSSGNINSFRILNLSGELVTEGKVSGTSVFINLDNDPPGVYFIIIESVDGGYFTKKLLKL